MSDNSLDHEAMLFRFNRLMQELMHGVLNRNCFRPWEIELLLDIEACSLRDRDRRQTLRRYQKAVHRQMQGGATQPLKLSEYLESRRGRRQSPSLVRRIPRDQPVSPSPESELS